MDIQGPNMKIVLALDNFCRTCMNVSNNHVSIFEHIEVAGSKLEQICSVLTKCTHIQISKNDGCSQYICIRCIARLTDAYAFREECYETKEKFEQLYQKASVENDIPITSQAFIEENVKIDATRYGNDLQNESKPVLPEFTIKNCDDNDHFEDTASVESLEASALHTDYEEIPENTNKNAFACPECNKSFVLKASMRKHMKIHFEAERLQCSICKKQFTRSTDVKRHMTRHTGEKPYACTVCNRAFTQSGTLATHMRKHDEFKTAKAEKSLDKEVGLCPICGKSFKELSGLKIHIRRHNGDKPYFCNFCDMRFVSSGRLTSHKRIHTGERPFVCQYCDKCFSHSTVLSKHLKTHLEVKPYHCPYCLKMFSTVYYLNIHKRQHTGEKPMKCKVCQKRFSDPKILKQHLKIHTGEKPYLCMVCGKAFRRSHHLKTHMNLHTRSS